MLRSTRKKQKLTLGFMLYGRTVVSLYIIFSIWLHLFGSRSFSNSHTAQSPDRWWQFRAALCGRCLSDLSYTYCHCQLRLEALFHLRTQLYRNKHHP